MNNLTTTPLPSNEATRAPFHFNSAAYLLQIDREKAASVGELLEALRSCSEDSIFQHTFRTLQQHHFIGEGFSNDFAHWAHLARNEEGLAKKLAGLDIRSFTSIGDLRAKLVKIVEEYLQGEPASRNRPALKPFCFCSSETVVIPTTFVANSFREFINALEKVSVHSIHYHFIEARLRLKLKTNDFSQWLKSEMGFDRMAGLLDDLDIYVSSLEEIRSQLVLILRSAVD
jgi:uncharacterized protein DUF5752